MTRMTARAQRQQRTHPPLWWPRAFVVLGLLVGVLAMHGLAPGGGVTDSAHHGHRTQASQPPSQATQASQPMSMRAEPSGVRVCHGMGSHGGHTRHADVTCASGAVPAGHTFPALTPDPAGAPVLTAHADRSRPRSPEGARAPPSLAELQLLRI